MKPLEDIYHIYRLGRLHRLRSVTAEQKKSSQAYNLIQCVAVLDMFCKTPLYLEMFPASTEAGQKLKELARVLFLDAGRNPESEVSISDAIGIKTGLTQFETLLEHELGKLPAYLADSVGIYSADELINRADLHLGTEALSVLEHRVKDDVRAAGRCLAFGLFTASGFHSVRAVEASARSYHRLVTGGKLTRGPWDQS